MTSSRKSTVEHHAKPLNQNSLGKNWTCSTVWKFYFQNISRVFLEYFHTTDNIISILWN